MRDYIWLNPVVSAAYEGSALNRVLSDEGFEIVQPEQDHISAVRNEYRDLLDRSGGVVLDQRCPEITEAFHRMNSDVVFHDIDPILIHVAKELASRKDLKDGHKWIITPCASLKRLGDSLQLENTIFMTWDDFTKYIKLAVPGKKPEDSPIPFGFFDRIEQRTIRVGKENLDQLDLHGVRLIEGLYCKNGCHNGDGVQCLNERRY